jgi:hypothetical protein
MTLIRASEIRGSGDISWMRTGAHAGSAHQTGNDFDLAASDRPGGLPFALGGCEYPERRVGFGARG